MIESRQLLLFIIISFCTRLIFYFASYQSSHNQMSHLDSTDVNWPTSAFETLPTDILKEHIFRYLEKSSFVACSLSCRRFYKISHQLTAAITGAEKYEQSTKILQSIFRAGSLEYLCWFQHKLRYPTTTSLPSKLLHLCLLLAAEGINYFIAMIM